MSQRMRLPYLVHQRSRFLKVNAVLIEGANRVACVNSSYTYIESARVGSRFSDAEAPTQHAAQVHVDIERPQHEQADT
eukprot:15484644-Alexandrium_andersonii.AAC.1